MKKSKKQAFTLIELLVVVLIIGILAAVAVPQYQKAVVKSRYAILKNLVKSVADAEEVYYLANGEYTGGLEKLDIELNKGIQSDEVESNEDDVTFTERFFPWGSCTLDRSRSEFYCRNTDIEMSYQIRFRHHPSEPGGRRCNVYVEDKTNSIQAKICQVETNTSTPISGGSYKY
ncbi:MAG: type II secretion system protein [Elusimicrobiaceae bacterium]|nr:type II secretion system protein [Elusimicrobiaceae bacterium]